MLKSKHLIVFILSIFITHTSQAAVLSVGGELYQEFLKTFQKHSLLDAHGGVYLIEVDESELPVLSHLAHEKLKICAGYMFEENALIAKANLRKFTAKKPNFTFPETFSKEHFLGVVEQVQDIQILSTIESLSAFKNRYYNGQEGVKSQKWLMSKWEEIIKDSPSASVELFHHSNFQQPSVVLTFEGSEKKDELLILGGHGDSTSGWFPSPRMHAPGADDNASGIATLTETIRVLVESDFAPQKTVKFMSYAAEEVGLRGSQDIARTYASEGKEIKGVLQFDMTNFSASEYDVVLIDDFTTDSQNQYMGRLIDEYFPDFKWTFDSCGYACSDHASWYREDYPVSFPFETTFDTHNTYIHTEDDTLEISHNSAAIASKFSKLALAYVLEMSQ